MQITDVFPRGLFSVGGVEVRDTIVVTWVIMVLLALFSWIVTRRLAARPGGFQTALEVTTDAIVRLIEQNTSFSPARFLPFIGSMAVFLVAANTISMIPWVGSPTRDLSTTAALAVIVFFAVHYYGVRLLGFRRYLSTYVEPHWLLLPFNVVGEISRSIALALRLFGNMLSGELVVAVLLLLAGLLVPVPMQILGLLIGLIQAYVFTLLAMVYIAAALRVKEEELSRGETQ